METLSGQNCLVTGGAGFIGSHLTDELIRLGAEVSVLDDFSTGREENLSHLTGNSHLKIIRGSITDPELLAKTLPGKNYIFHLAALPSVVRSVEDPVGTHHVNVNGTLALLTEARRNPELKRFVLTSSSSVYGDTPTLPKSEEMAGQVLSPYALHKWIGENYIRLFSSLYGFPGVSLRPFNVFGPRQDPHSDYAAVIPRFIRAALSGQPLQVFGDGEQTRDFTNVKNMVRIFILAATAGDSSLYGQAFNAGTGERISVNELARAILELTGSESRISHAPPRPGDVRDSFACLKGARQKLGYEPVIGFHEGLRELTREFQENTQ